ncbi:hypothetical protein GWP87_17230 [Morganella morganii]|nr:hypothetical protein AKG16_15805 [Morganella morganii]MDF2407521.1 hypothetical protein [Morganella morganii]
MEVGASAGNSSSSNIDIEPNESSNTTSQDDYEVLKDKEIIADRKADRKLRELFGNKAYNVVRKTLYGWAILLTVYAFCNLFFGKQIFSDQVLIAITSAVTLNTFAAFLGVIRGLFPSGKQRKSEEK